MGEILELYKNIGETPLECIMRFKADHPEYGETKMTYLGRLDPMAEGLLLVLSGNTRAKEEYLGLDKTYEFEVLWGIETDTYDILGEVKKVDTKTIDLQKKMPKIIENMMEKKVQSYPPYSSRTVAGKPLFQYARENKIEEIEIPQRGIKIFSVEHQNTRMISGEEILKEIAAKIELIKGDFRQESILNNWKTSLTDKLGEKFLVSSFVASVSSGTYIRSLAHEMGQDLGVGALAYSIKRTRVGKYTLTKA